MHVANPYAIRGASENATLTLLLKQINFYAKMFGSGDQTSSARSAARL